jgi:two-component system, response regulator PdtaR
MHALIIEDEGFIALAIEDVLRECGFHSFDIAPSPQAAYEAVARECPTLITSDVQLTPGCGIETVLRIYDFAPAPVLFITGNASEVTDRLPNAAVLSKPFVAQQLIDAVDAILPGVSSGSAGH